MLLDILIAITPLLTGTTDATTLIGGIVVALLGVYLLYRGITALRKPKPELQSVSYMNPTAGIPQSDNMQ